MATSILKNDFTGGIMSPRLYGRYNSAPYQNGCMKLKNFAIMPQGGITRRPGTRLKNTPDHTQTPERAALAGSRLIPFCLSTTMNFIIELGNNCLRVWRQDADQLMRFTIGSTVYTTLTVSQLTDVTSLYTTAEAEQVQYAQDYEHLYIAHRNHKPLVITYSEVTEGGSLDVAVSKSSFGPKLYGAFPEGADMGDGRVYIRLEQDGTTYLFEAFPIYESNLLGEGSGDGFTLTLSPDYALSGTCHVTVIRGETAWSGPDLVLQ